MITESPKWIDIAQRPRTKTGSGLLYWEALPDSPYTTTQAKQMVNDGIAMIAHRHEPDRVVMCVMLRKQRIKASEVFW